MKKSRIVHLPSILRHLSLLSVLLLRISAGNVFCEFLPEPTPENPQLSDSISSTDSLSLQHSVSSFPLEDTTSVVPPDNPEQLPAKDTVAVQTDTHTLHSAATTLYPGISRLQDSLARSYIASVYEFNWADAAKKLRKLHRIERKHKLLPLSGLLGVSSRVLRILNNEYENDKIRQQLLHEITDLKKKTLERSIPQKLPDSLRATALFIRGGVNGFSAALKIDDNAVSAAIDGLSALHQLEEAQTRYPQFHDVNLGLGLFYCMLAKAPLIVRAALNLLGPLKSFDEGIALLRDSARRGRYTRDAARLYLIEFLSPYWGHLEKEKDELFSELEQSYPENPYYRFLRNHENICFHPEVLDTTLCSTQLPTAPLRMKKTAFSIRRYAKLIALQHHYFCDDSSAGVLQSQLTDTLREYSFYPLFLKALSERRNEKGNKNSRKARQLSTSENEALRLFGLSRMSSTRKRIFEWHMRDALRIR